MDNQNDYKIITDDFEGPLDLLLHLIEKRKLLINNISLSQITDDYIQYIKNNQNYSINKNSHFILVASTLLLIKSKSLLPTLELTDEEKYNIDDLEKRLKIYKRMKDTEKFILDMFGKNINYFANDKTNLETYFVPNQQINKENLFTSIKNIIKNLPKVEIKPKIIVQKVISLDEMIGRLTKRITENLNLSFKDFSGYGKVEKVNVIVSFLAMLELVKEGTIDVIQKDKNDIEMQTKQFDTPKYI